MMMTERQNVRMPDKMSETVVSTVFPLRVMALKEHCDQACRRSGMSFAGKAWASVLAANAPETPILWPRRKYLVRSEGRGAGAFTRGNAASVLSGENVTVPAFPVK